MKRKVNVLLGALLVAFMLVVLVGTMPAAADGPPAEFPRNDMAPDGPDARDLTPDMIGEKEVAIRKKAAEVGSAVATNASPIGNPAAVGEEITVTVSDNGLGIDYDETFVVVMDGEHGIILIEKAAYDNYDAATDEYVFPNPNGCWRPEDRISTDQLSYLLSEFDNNMWPVETEVFGEPLPRGDEGQKVWTLIHNIRDDSYYDCSATSYIAGYFSASENAENNKNMMHIDSYDWQNRTGPEAARPFLYEGTFAHEFEHLIHFDIDPDEPSWVDEGLADLAGYLAGYGHSSGHVANYMVYHPLTALTFWGGGLEDYGASYLFQLYLFEKFGGADFVSALVAEQANGIEGIENTLAAFGFSESFDEIFDNWTIANYIDDTRKDDGKYGYETLDIGSADSWGYSIEYALQNFWWGPSDATPFAGNYEFLSGAGPQPYTAQYFRFNNDKRANVWIDGDDYAGTPAYSGTYEWYSDAEAWAWRSFYQSFDIPAGGATLEFMTFFEIEDDWDYGYVEVYDHNTGEWYTLDAAGTVDYVAHGQDNPNTPDEREPVTYEAAGRWHGFTGNSGGWIPVSMDLTPFAGHTIDLYFTTWQDGAFTLQMMYVDDISIQELGFADDVEAGEDGWTSTGWFVTDGIVDNGFGVVTIDTKGVDTARYPEPSTNNRMTLRGVRMMDVEQETQEGVDSVPATPLNSGRVQVSIVANHADHILTSSYLFGAE
jgi:hypothetical protein